MQQDSNVPPFQVYAFGYQQKQAMSTLHTPVSNKWYVTPKAKDTIEQSP